MWIENVMWMSVWTKHGIMQLNTILIRFESCAQLHTKRCRLFSNVGVNVIFPVAEKIGKVPIVKIRKFWYLFANI